jgi:hypothetical protein
MLVVSVLICFSLVGKENPTRNRELDRREKLIVMVGVRSTLVPTDDVHCLLYCGGQGIIYEAMQDALGYIPEPGFGQPLVSSQVELG